jgi:replicative DNA helicase
MNPAINIDAEARCLSTLMKGAEGSYAASAVGLTSEQFSDPQNRIIFAAIMRAAAEVRSTDLESVWTQLVSMGGKSPVELGALASIEAMEPTSLNRARYVATVIACARQRALLSALAKAQAEASQDAQDWPELWARVAPHIQAAQETTATSTLRTVAEMAATVRREIEEPDTARILPSCFPSWDRVARAFRAWEMITLAGRPGTGKSALALQLALSVALRGMTCAFFSLEMSGEELVTRLALNHGGPDVAGDHPKARTRFLAELDNVGALKTLHVFDNRLRCTVDTIEARCRLLAAAPGGLAFVVIDYLQLIDPTDIRAPREQQVAQMSRRLKQLTGVVGAPILVLSQLNRESEKEERRPRLSDLRESGSIEQDSDRVWFLWNEPDKGAPKFSEETESIDVSLIQAKCRGGRPNIFTRLRFDRPCYRFTQISNQ